MNHLKIENIDENLAIDFLKHECKLRKSEEMQDYYDFLDESSKGRQETVENFVQFKTIRDFGFTPSQESLKNYTLSTSNFIKIINILSQEWIYIYIHSFVH